MRKKRKEMQIPDNGGYMAQRRNILNPNSSFIVKEAYKSLRTNIRFSLRSEGCKTLCVISGVASEGKSITILNLAISIAESGQRVLLIDADMRRPTMHRLLVEKPTPGLSNVLAGLATCQEAVRKQLCPNLDLLFSGDVPPNPSELLGGHEMESLIETLSSDYDYILIDTPPVGVVSDACLLANLLDGALLLVRQGYAKKEEVKRTVRKLQLTGVKILGYVFNAVPAENRGYYNYYYYYGYGEHPDEKKS